MKHAVFERRECMKHLVKVFLITSIVVGALVSAKLIVEFYETRVKRYMDVD